MTMNNYSAKTLLRMTMRVLFAALTALSLYAQAADNTTQTIVHMLDYVSVDYPEFVKDGKVLDESEYKEQLEFATQAGGLLATLQTIP